MKKKTPYAVDLHDSHLIGTVFDVVNSNKLKSPLGNIHLLYSQEQMTRFYLSTVNYQRIISCIYVKNKHLPMVEIS